MKKLISFSLFFAFAALLLVGCQSSENITSPIDDLDKRPGLPDWGLPYPVNTDNGPVTVDLVAGQNQVVGSITVSNNGVNIYVTYNTTGDWVITETHLDAAYHPSLIPQNAARNPMIGTFRYGKSENISPDGQTAGPYTIPIADLPGTNIDNMVYIGAHAVVEGNCEESLNAGICPIFPETAQMTPTWNPQDAPLYTVKAVFDFTSEAFYGFCVDNLRSIGEGVRTVEFLCSYDEMPVCTPPQFFIEKPENLDLINWIINNRESNWDRRTLQTVFWKLINPSGTATNYTDPNASPYWTHDATLREQIIDLAELNGEGYEPGCGEKVLVLVYGPGEICDPIRQVIAIEVPVECETECGDETAWAFNYPVEMTNATSSLFPGHVWFRYFGYKLF